MHENGLKIFTQLHVLDTGILINPVLFLFYIVLQNVTESYMLASDVDGQRCKNLYMSLCFFGSLFPMSNHDGRLFLFDCCEKCFLLPHYRKDILTSPVAMKGKVRWGAALLKRRSKCRCY